MKLNKCFFICKTLIVLMLFFSCKSSFSQTHSENTTVHIPEPLMFDLVRGLGAKQGELEVNSLADFPLNKAAARGTDWAPEIEYALFDNFAVELEFPMNNLKLEAYKTAIQWTMGTSKNKQFIHGVQVIAEKYIHDDLLELNFLYIPAYRFNETWSAIGLFGVMLESGADAAKKKHTVLLNASVFADLNEKTVLGIEFNNTDPTFQERDDNKMELLVLPQMHYELNRGFSVQFGLGAKWHAKDVDTSGVVRVIKTF